MLVLFFDCPSEHLQKSEKEQTYHDWFLIKRSMLVNQKIG